MISWYVWQSSRGNRMVTHWASMRRWIWSISECNLTTSDSRKWTPIGGPFARERRGSRPEKQQPKHNPCRPVGRNCRSLATSGSAGKIRHLLIVCLTKIKTIGWNPNGVSTRSMIFVRWHSPSQALTTKHVLYPQLTAIVCHVMIVEISSLWQDLLTQIRFWFTLL